MLLFEITYTFAPLDRVAERIVLLIRSCLKIDKLFSSGIWTPLIVAHDLNLSAVAAIGCLYNNGDILFRQYRVYRRAGLSCVRVPTCYCVLLLRVTCIATGRSHLHLLIREVQQERTRFTLSVNAGVENNVRPCKSDIPVVVISISFSDHFAGSETESYILPHIRVAVHRGVEVFYGVNLDLRLIFVSAGRTVAAGGDHEGCDQSEQYALFQIVHQLSVWFYSGLWFVLVPGSPTENNKSGGQDCRGQVSKLH